MTGAVFPNHVAHALDRLTVPMLPTGFADRLAARIAADDLPLDTGVDDIALPDLRRPMGVSGWRRSARIAVVASAFGLATATAAASGVFGDPVYIPVVSQALASAQIVEMPVEKPVAAKVSETKKPENVPAKPVVIDEPMGKEAVLAVLSKLRDDPEFRSLPRPARQERTKAELARLIADGKARKADVKAAWAQIAMERQTRVQERRRQGLPVAEHRTDAAKPPIARPKGKQITPEQKAKARDAYNQLTEEQRAELQVLRQRRQYATPQERRAIQREIRAFWVRSGVKPATEDVKNEAP